MTAANRPPLAHDPEEKIPPFGFRVEVLQDGSVRYANQPIALVMAETFEAATEGAVLLRPQYETEPVRATMESGVPFEPGAVGVGSPPRTVFGDIDVVSRRPRTSPSPITRRRRNITTPWNRTLSSPSGTAIG